MWPPWAGSGLDIEMRKTSIAWRTIRDGAWAPASVLVLYAVAAKLFQLYLIFPWIDMPTHFLGGAAITYFYLVGIRHAQEEVGPLPRVVQVLLAVGFTAISAVVWEFWEFACDVGLGTRMNLGVRDTLFDLFFGLAGAAAVGGGALAILGRAPGAGE